jgi:hypothetical protein
VIPKAWPIKGLKPANSAAREAYEEAGVRDTIKMKAVGIFSYKKRPEEDGITSQPTRNCPARDAPMTLVLA